MPAMVARIATIAFQGLDAVPVDVQVQVAAGLPAFTIVGLADKAVTESRERVRSALSAVGLSLPPKRITVNLAPADLPKEGSHYDLPIALGLLAAMEVLPEDALAGFVAMGELGLDAGLTGSGGALLAALHASDRELGLICPAAVGAEAALADGVEILAAPGLLHLVNHLRGTQVLAAPEPAIEGGPAAHPDMAEVKGQETAKRVLEIAAAGAHHLLMLGPPGAGKSMLAARLPGILPPLGAREALEVAMIASAAGGLPGGRLTRARPYRDPHHSASLPALIGGGARAKPGEVSLAHNGVLFLDELAEYQRGVLDALRQPLETGQAVVARVNAHVTYPARFQLVAAMNPCRCGHLADPAQACARAPRCAAEYQNRISGPLLDRFDLFVEVPPMAAADMARPATGEPGPAIAARVGRARAAQVARYAGELAAGTNAGVPTPLMEKFAIPDADGQALLSRAAEAMKLTARGYHRVLRVARTIADLEGSDAVRRPHLAEALSYRRQVPG